ncbi:translin-associated x protein [Rutstroemia sp. NJR-2017a BBW]|nr:translin-associated x protein [Rutstroemia sp. NJR-2017a BBW]
MPGVKRQHDGTSKPGGSASAQTASTSPFMPMFETFRAELDEHHDRRERIIKASRDITALSKKIAQALHTPLPPKIASESNDRLTTIQTLFTSIVPDLAGINSWRYQRQISGGVQEYMEAVSFSHYLTQQSLISLSQAQDSLPAGIELTGDDYVLGLFDLVGEIMRFAVTRMATDGRLPASSVEDRAEERTILSDLRILRTEFESLDTTRCGNTGLGRDVEKKMEVMRTCVEKVETAVYGMIVRGRERPKGWVMDVPDEGGRGEVESY